jgi:beta-phosphoglucomutase-like phosphatase (HAD superfamily)
MSDTAKKRAALIDVMGTLSANRKWAPLIQELRDNGVLLCLCTGMDKLNDYDRDHAIKQGVNFTTDKVLTGASKDWPEYYNRTAKELGVNVEDMVLIDDGKNPMLTYTEEENENIAAAREAGAKGIHVPRKDGQIDLGYIREKLVKLAFISA